MHRNAYAFWGMMRVSQNKRLLPSEYFRFFSALPCTIYSSSLTRLPVSVQIDYYYWGKIAFKRYNSSSRFFREAPGTDSSVPGKQIIEGDRRHALVRDSGGRGVRTPIRLHLKPITPPHTRGTFGTVRDTHRGCRVAGAMRLQLIYLRSLHRTHRKGDITAALDKTFDSRELSRGVWRVGEPFCFVLFSPLHRCSFRTPHRKHRTTRRQQEIRDYQPNTISAF